MKQIPLTRGRFTLVDDEDYMCFGIRPCEDTFFDLVFLSQDDELEVIGNIHDNPELLEKT